jgi:hypothetical protein
MDGSEETYVELLPRPTQLRASAKPAVPAWYIGPDSKYSELREATYAVHTLPTKTREYAPASQQGTDK